MRKKLVICISAIFSIALLVVGIQLTTGVNRSDVVLPPTRIGTEGESSALLEKRYTIESAYTDADMVARIRIGDWLGEETEFSQTYFEATIVDRFKGEELEKIVLLQDGNSQYTLKGFPLFTSGNELLVFLKEAQGVEYENAYWMLGAFTAMLDYEETDAGEGYYMDRYGVFCENLDLHPNYASQSALSAELYTNAAKRDAIVDEMGYRYPYIFAKEDIEKLISELQQTY